MAMTDMTHTLHEGLKIGSVVLDTGCVPSQPPFSDSGCALTLVSLGLRARVIPESGSSTQLRVFLVVAPGRAAQAWIRHRDGFRM